jgi:hypothetical protein
MRTVYTTLAVVGIAAAVACFALSQAPSSGMNLHTADKTFVNYMAKYGKSYATQEEFVQRKELFEKILAEISHHNSQNDQTWFMALNKFSDMTEAEVKLYLGGGISGEHRPHLDVE